MNTLRPLRSPLQQARPCQIRHPPIWRPRRTGAPGSASCQQGAGSSPSPDNQTTQPAGWMERWKSVAREQSENLQQWGIAGVVAYGALNLVYYSTAFVLCWVYIAKVPKGQGLSAAAAALPKVLALVWGGSQVTKLPRAAGALFLAPFVDRLLLMSVELTPLESKQQAFAWFLGICLTLTLVMFSVVVFAWR